MWKFKEDWTLYDNKPSQSSREQNGPVKKLSLWQRCDNYIILPSGCLRRGIIEVSTS